MSGKKYLTLEQLIEELKTVNFDVTKIWINTLQRQQGFPKVQRNQYDLVECLKWLVMYRDRQRMDAKRESASKEESDSMKSRYQAAMLEMKMRKEIKLLTPTSDIIKNIEPILQSVRSMMMGIPKKAARELSNKELEPYLDDFIRKSLHELSATVTKLSELGTLPGLAEPLLPDFEASATTHGERVGGQVQDVKPRTQRRKRAMANLNSRIPTGDDGHMDRPHH